MSALLPVVVGVLLIWLIGLVRDRVAGLRRYTVSVSLVDVANLPESLSARTEAIVGRGPILDHPRSILDPELAVVAARALEKKPWVKRVLGARRRFPASFEVRLEIREPLAVVCAGGERLAVDEDGVVLEHDTTQGPPEIPEIRVPGAPLARVPVDGQRFGRPSSLKGHEAVHEALAVLRDIRAAGDHPALESLRILEVRLGESGRARGPGDPDVRLVLDSRVEILWGRSSIAPLARIEPSPSEKLDNLLRTVRKYPGLLGISVVDLHLNDPEVELAR